MDNQGQQTILIGVTGCIAAYKSAELVRAFQKRGYRVKVVMTPHATEFVGPTTFRALTHEPVAVGLFDDPSDPIHHISLAQEADAFVIAPCTANALAKLACGIADDLLTTTALACTAPLVIAPAMNVHMYEAAATQANMQTLRQRGARFVEAGDGYLACGDVGRGRLADLDDIVRATEHALAHAADMTGMNVMITAGPTVEPIDAVRFISNYSSGKTGYALAQAAARRGANVTLVSGPVALAAPEGVRMVAVQTARDMLAASKECFAQADLAIFTAAVADMRPQAASTRKLKKGADDEALSQVSLTSNPDILATLAAGKQPGQTVVGFAAETDDVLANAQRKLQAKHADMIVANLVGKDKGFGTDDNQVWLVSGQGVDELPLMPKRDLAEALLDKALELRS